MLFHRLTQINTKSGQVAPFLIVIIVILLIATMVTVNLGKVGLTKTNTSNAADAGALAGGTMHTNTLNSLAHTNTAMIAEYLATVVIFAQPWKSICSETKFYIMYLAFSAAQAAQFAFAWRRGSQGYSEARKAAKQLAFSNAGVDEALKKDETYGGYVGLKEWMQRRSSQPAEEAYEEWLKAESKFGEWMENEGYESGYYAWTDAQGGDNSVRVDVDAPDFPGLIPMPGVLVGVYTDGAFPPLAICGPCNAACSGALIAYHLCVKKTGVSSDDIEAEVGIACECPPCCCECHNVVVVGVFGGFIHGVAYMLPSSVGCGGTVTNIIFYPVPIAFIADIVSDNPELTVTTTRVEPARDLGIWQMVYDDPQRAGGGISSSARARTSGGAVGPVPSAEYDSYLITGGY